MARGLLSGIILGGVVGVGVTGVVSVLAPMPNPPEVADAAPQAATPVALVQTDSGDGGSGTDRAVATGLAAPQVSAPQTDRLEMDSAALASAKQPQTGTVSDLASLEAQGSDSGVDLTTEAPVLPNPQALAPMAPQDADDLSISTEPAQPPAPLVAEEAGAFETAQEAETPVEVGSSVEGAAPEEAPAPRAEIAQAPTLEAVEQSDAMAQVDEVSEGGAPQTAAVKVEAVEVEEAVAEQTVSAPSSAQDTDIAEPTETASDVGNIAQNTPVQATEPATFGPDSAEAALTETEAEAEMAEAETAQAEPQTDVADAAPESEIDTAELTVPQIAPVPAPESIGIPAPRQNIPSQEVQADGTEEAEDGGQAAVTLRPSIGRPVGSLTERQTDGVKIRRSGSAPQTQAENTQDDAGVVTQAQADPGEGDQRPIRQFAQAVEVSEGKPLMSIVLIDNGTSSEAGSAGIAELRNFPYPLTFAVDATLEDAQDRMKTYRSEGFEVMAMVDLPEGALATDAEITFGAILPQLPEIVGVLEGPAGGLQGSREVSDQVTSILRQTGHGLITQDRGLNTMPKLARKEGVPADPIFRDFDGKGQSAQVIRRFLDQAAFKAGQEGAVVMLGRLQPDSISALLVWGLQDRAGKVALVPVSAVLLRDE